MPEVTTESILSWLEEQVREKLPVDAHTWVDASAKLNILIGDEHDKLWDLQQEVARLEVMRIEGGDSAAKAKVYIRATDEYKFMKKQEARIGRIEEAIRISKIQARLKDNEIRSY